MSKLIRDISRDIKCKIKHSDEDIRKAINYKDDYLELSSTYYNFSINGLNDALELHETVVELIEEYRKKNGEPPKTMLELWNYEHKGLMEDAEEVKVLQEFYKNL